MIDETILEKIKKLFALASNNPNENEAMVASQMAMKLLAKHNLSMESFNGLTIDAETKIDKEMLSGRYEEWKGKLLSMCAFNCFCLSFSDLVDKKRRAYLVGNLMNRMAASCLYRYLESVIPIITEAEMKRINPNCGVGTAEIWKSSFRQGLLIRLYERMQEQRRETTEEYTGMVRYNMYEQAQVKNKQYLEDQGMHLVNKTSKKGYENNSAKEAGYSAGAGVSLNPSRELPSR